MYQPSAAFVEQMDTRPFRAALTGLRGTVALDTLEYDAPWCPTAFSLGNANAASFSAQVNGGAMPLEPGEGVTLSAGLLLEDGGREEVPLGKFVLTRVERDPDTDQWTLAGEDALSARLGEEYFCADVGNPPATAPQVLSEICQQTGLQLEGGDLVPGTAMALEYDAVGGSGSSMRELVGQIALLAGANALVDRNGVLRLCRLEDTQCRVGPDRYYESSLTLEHQDFVLGALEVTVPTTRQGESGLQEEEQVYTAQLEGETRGISLSAQWFDQTAFDGMWQAWQGRKWRPGQITFLGDLRLDPGDVITVADREGTEYSLAVMALKHSFDGGFQTTVSCYSPAESGSAQTQTVSQAITGLKTDLGRFRRLYADNLEATAAQIKHITTEDIVGEYGTINLAKGTFQFGDALVWDGQQMTIRGVLESEEGTIGGWTIQGKTLYSVTNSGDFRMELKPAVADEVPYILMQGVMGSSFWIVPYIGETSGILERMELICGDAVGGSRISLNRDGMVTTDGGLLWPQDGLQVEKLILNGAQVQDSVVAQGTSGSWKFSKWANGLAICFTTTSYCNSNWATQTWGSDTCTDDITFPDYPFPFVEEPVCYASLAKPDDASQNGYFFWPAHNSNGSVSRPPTWCLVRPDGLPGTYAVGHPRIKMVAIGRWK